MRWLPLILFASLGLLLWAGIRLSQQRDPNAIPSPFIARPLPAFSLPMLHDPSRTVDSASLIGTPYLLNVWASWCAPCRAEMGSLDRLARRHNGKQFHIIGISTDDHADKAQAFVVGAGVSFDNYLDKNLVLENMLGANRIPLTVLVDKDGKVVRKVYGAREWDSRENKALIGQALGVKLD